MSSASLLIAAPLFAPLLSGIACLLIRQRPWRQALALGGALLLLITGILLAIVVANDGIQVLRMGAWPAPFGIVLVADAFSALMVVLSGIVGLTGMWYHVQVAAAGEAEEEAGMTLPLLHLLLLGVCGAFLTGDLFNLYVWFEVLLMASFVLLVQGGGRERTEAGITYVTINLLASILFLSAVGIIYATTGTVNMADLARTLAAMDHGQGMDGTAITAASLLVVAFGIKAGLFPLYFWLPASYHTPPVAISAIFAGLLTKVGVYALIRVFTLIFPVGTTWLHPVIMYLGIATMVVGVLGALAQTRLRRILSFHIISQVGYMVLGIGIGTSHAIAASVFYIGHHIIVKSNLMLICGHIGRLGGSERLTDLGGFNRLRPWLGLVFLVPALSLAGMPPLSGFFAKLGLVISSLETQRYGVAIAILGVGLLTLLSMLKIWNQVFQQPASQSDQPPPFGRQGMNMAPMILLALITIAIGLGAGPLYDFCLQAGRELTGRQAYLDAVLDGMSEVTP